MLEIYYDKAKEFECRVMVEGASLSSTKARLILQGDKYNIIYEGKIDSKGWCTIKINPTKNLFEHNETGKAVLEVIAEDTLFEPWNSKFKVLASKKVTVEVINKNKKVIRQKKPQVTAIIPTKSKKTVSKPLNEKKVTINNISKKLQQHLVKSGVNKRMIYANPKKVTFLVESFLKRYRFGGQSGKKIIVQALNKIYS